MRRPLLSQIVAAAAGWYSVHADLNPPDPHDRPTRELVSLRPVAAFALAEDQERDDLEPLQAIVCRDGCYVGAPDGFEWESGEQPSFLGYLAPGIDLEVFRGPALHLYERSGRRAA